MSHAAPPPGIGAHIRDWFDRDVEPDLARFREALPHLVSLANVVLLVVKAADPAIAPELAAAVDVAEEVAEAFARITGETKADRM